MELVLMDWEISCLGEYAYMELVLMNWVVIFKEYACMELYDEMTGVFYCDDKISHALAGIVNSDYPKHCAKWSTFI